MTKSELRETYSRRKKEFTSHLEKATTEINLISNLRIFLALTFVVTLYFAFQIQGMGVLAAASLAGFLYLIKKHSILYARKTHLQNLVNINAAEEQVLNANYSALQDGSRFIDVHHPYTHDLDIFGPGSLFQYLNRCTTHGGQAKLAHLLQYPLNDAAAIAGNQEAIRELGSKIDFRQHFQAAGMESGEQPDDAPQLLSWLKQPSFLPDSKWLSILLVVIPSLTLISLVAAIFFSLAKLPLFLLILTQWIFAAIYLKRINVFHDYISRKKNILRRYSHLLSYIEQEAFTSSKLKSVSTAAHQAHSNVIRLATLVSALDARSNSLMTFFVNSLLMYDLQCVYRLEKWKNNNAGALVSWLDAIYDAEVLTSFSTLHYNNPGFCFATISNVHEVQALSMAHPLLPGTERIPNDFRLGPHPSVAIITGANMAGKSTFLRTLGVNMVLALNGAPVCASDFRTGLLVLRSGMRTADSLQDHQSYFFAELNRLKNIMDELKSGQPLLVLLDEILKGTNSNDKQAGSIALVKQLIPFHALTIIATHDLALGALETEHAGNVVNYCFEANIENDQLSFDYKLKKGLATRMNASFLMKKMGIIP